ncbi:hypothetical protein BHM03_00034621 [Ensete ventricosum]|uniref:Uncharacterized protein n=1 Tax=Ensete ventricosum TaxID=4639 RepID=A0A445MJ50_ENSVE|nr:hypothetical protein BHM03_00034621 [Ensete ventricosum]
MAVGQQGEEDGRGSCGSRSDQCCTRAAATACVGQEEGDGFRQQIGILVAEAVCGWQWLVVKAMCSSGSLMELGRRKAAMVERIRGDDSGWKGEMTTTKKSVVWGATTAARWQWLL